MTGWEGKDPLVWAAEMKDAPREAVSRFAFLLFERVVMRTPVDTGAARQNWLVTVNGETDAFDAGKAGDSVLTDGAKVIEGAKGDDSIVIQNNAPYIRKLEYGGYTEKMMTEKTVGGYSKQAPAGMVGVVMSGADGLWEKALEAGT